MQGTNFVYTYAELHNATNGFSRDLLVGEGGYGSVYRGNLRGSQVAIKKLNPQGLQVRGTSSRNV